MRTPRKWWTEEVDKMHREIEEMPVHERDQFLEATKTWRGTLSHIHKYWWQADPSAVLGCYFLLGLLLFMVVDAVWL